MIDDRKKTTNQMVRSVPEEGAVNERSFVPNVSNAVPKKGSSTVPHAGSAVPTEAAAEPTEGTSALHKTRHVASNDLTSGRSSGGQQEAAPALAALYFFLAIFL